MAQLSRNVPSDVALEVFEGLSEGVVVIDRDWRYRYVNPCGAELLQTTVDALLGKAYLEVHPEARGSAFQLAYERVLVSGVSEVLEEHYEPLDKTFRNRVIPWSDGIVIFYSDISEERRREAALLGELDVLQQVVGHADAAVALLDLDGRCLLVNGAAARFVAREPEALVGKLVTDLVPPAFGERLVELIDVIRRTRTAESFEQAVQLAQGEPERDLSVVLFPTYDVAGELAGMGIIASDITTWRAAERAAAASDHRFRVMFAQTSLGQVVIEVGECVVDANDAFCALLGYSLAELRTMKAADIIVAGEAVAALHVRLRGAGVLGYEREDEMLRKDGSHVPVLRSVSLFDDPQTGRPMAATIVRDLSAVRELERTRVEDEWRLREANEMLVRFESLVEGAAEFIAMSDMDREVWYINPAGRRLLGLEPHGSLEGVQTRDFLTPEGLELALRLELPSVLETGAWQGESTLKDLRGGPAIPTSVSSFLMRHPSTGEQLGLATVQEDLRERHRAARELAAAEVHRTELLGRLVQAQELERARIAADIHDDSVQAVAAADLRIGLLRRQVILSAPDCLVLADKAQESIAGAADRLRHLLFDLESPDPDIALRPALAQLAAHVLEDSSLRWDVVGDHVDLAYAERVTALRIAKEALLNVRKHAKAERVTVTLRCADGGVELTIADDGPSPAAATISSPDGHRGLATMRDRAEIAGGWWRLENADGGGLQVRTWLPGSRPLEQG